MNIPNFILFKYLINYKTLPLHPMNNAFYLLPRKKVYKIIFTRKKSLAVSEIHRNLKYRELFLCSSRKYGIRCWWLDSDTKQPSMCVKSLPPRTVSVLSVTRHPRSPRQPGTASVQLLSTQPYS